jgi:hypothetical protein
MHIQSSEWPVLRFEARARCPSSACEVRVRSKGGHATTILSISGARMRDLMSLEWVNQPKAWVLEPSGSPVDIEFILRLRAPLTELADSVAPSCQLTYR